MATSSNSMVTVGPSEVKDQPEDLELECTESLRSSTTSCSSNTSFSSSENDIVSTELVDWEGLERSEQREARTGRTDESTALLLARLEKENAALVKNPKSSLPATHPPSLTAIKKLVNGPQRQSLQHSLLPAPPMTELEFWAALVSDYPQTAQRLPTLTSSKIRAGVPAPLRGVVWPSIAGARDSRLYEEFQSLCGRSSPYEGLIGKDVGRSFPNIDMFRERDGEGQQMLGRVLKCFSLYDDKIGYCQGLGFVVGPLLMHMSDAEAFCVLIRLMEHYDLRSCYFPDLAGLHLRIFQFQMLLRQHLPDLASHLESLKVEPLYVSQWFLSFFAVTCPLPMLFRIYDVILAEGATETLMRVALSLMQRNEKKLQSFTEFEDAMQFLLSRGLWDTYAQHAEDLVTGFVSLSDLVSREALQALETSFRESQTLTVPLSFKSTASQILGRFWANSAHSISKSTGNLSLAIPDLAIRMSSSGQSLPSTDNSSEHTSEASTLATETTGFVRKSESFWEEQDQLATPNTSAMNSNDHDLHHQIEELLTALNEMQRHQSDMTKKWQREREEREEDQKIARSVVDALNLQTLALQDLAGGEMSQADHETKNLIDAATARFCAAKDKRVSILQTKHQLRDAAAEWKERHDVESARCQDLMKQLDEHEVQHAALREHLREARARIQEAHRDKQRLERTIQDFRSRKASTPESPLDLYSPVSEAGDLRCSPVRPGLREFKLGRPEAGKATTTVFSQRSSSLYTQGLLATEDHQPIDQDTLLQELVTAKTAEAVARQELDETKGKLDALRRIVSGPVVTPGLRVGMTESPTAATVNANTGLGADSDRAKMTHDKGSPVPLSKTNATPGGFFGSWGKRGS